MLVISEALHNGYIVKRLENKGRVRMCIPLGDRACEICKKDLKGIKCVRYDKGNLCLFWECIGCYNNSLILEAFEADKEIMQ